MIGLGCCLTALCAHAPACRAQGPADAADNQTLHISFISLTPGNAIGASQLRLHADGTLDFSIENETLSNSRGTWSSRGRRFSATADFTSGRRSSFRYRLLFDGYHLMGMYAGRARLREYDLHDRLTQEIMFLFYAVPPGALKRLRPGVPGLSRTAQPAAMAQAAKEWTQ